jgi:hypothetical protein
VILLGGRGDAATGEPGGMTSAGSRSAGPQRQPPQRGGGGGHEEPPFDMGITDDDVPF